MASVKRPRLEVEEMVVFFAVALTLIPAAAILYGYLRGARIERVMEDESSPLAELRRRWESAIAGLMNADLERNVGTLDDKDYRWIRDQYVSEAVTLLRAMDLEEQEEEELLADLEARVVTSSD